MSGRLVIVGTPIGHPEDLSPRGAQALRDANLVACEERREGLRLLRRLGWEGEVIEINEHTERDEAEALVDRIAAGSVVALVSDCGMPLVADPGSYLLQRTLARGLPVSVVPGPTSITTALALCDFDTRRFYFHGFLPAKKELRRQALRGLVSFPDALVFLEAPYRLLPVLEDMKTAFGSRRRVCLACDLTLLSEEVLRGTLGELVAAITASPRKCEFVLIVEGASSDRTGKR